MTNATGGSGLGIQLSAQLGTTKELSELQQLNAANKGAQLVDPLLKKAGKSFGLRLTNEGRGCNLKKAHWAHFFPKYLFSE